MYTVTRKHDTIPIDVHTKTKFPKEMAKIVFQLFRTNVTCCMLCRKFLKRLLKKNISSNG